MSKDIFAARARLPETVSILEILARAKALEAEGRKIIHMEIGEPDFDTPANIVEAGIRALKDGYTHYGPSAGLPEVRDAVAEFVARTRNVSVERDHVGREDAANRVVVCHRACVLLHGPRDRYNTHDPTG